MMAAGTLLQPPTIQHRLHRLTPEIIRAPSLSPNLQKNGNICLRYARIVAATSGFDTALPPIPTNFPPLPDPKLPPFRKVRSPNLPSHKANVMNACSLLLCSYIAELPRHLCKHLPRLAGLHLCIIANHCCLLPAFGMHPAYVASQPCLLLTRSIPAVKGCQDHA